MKYIYLPSVISFTLIIFFGEFSLKSRIVFWLLLKESTSQLCNKHYWKYLIMVNSFLAFAFKLGEFLLNFYKKFFPASIVFITVSFTNKKGFSKKKYSITTSHHNGKSFSTCRLFPGVGLASGFPLMLIYFS